MVKILIEGYKLLFLGVNHLINLFIWTSFFIFYNFIMDSFFKTLSPLAHLSKESQSALENISKHSELPKGHTLVAQNTICHNLYFIEHGLTRTYYLKNGKDITDWISTENTFAVSLISFINRTPDRRMIELLEPSIFYAFDYNDLENLCKKHHDIEHLVRKLVCLGFVQLQNRFDDLHFATAKERYKNLMLHNPSIIQRVPLGMVASFLGMTQETLSRIRSQK